MECDKRPTNFKEEIAMPDIEWCIPDFEWL